MDTPTNLEHFGEIVLKGIQFCQYLNAFQKEEKIIIKKNIEHKRLRQKNEKITKMPHFPMYFCSYYRCKILDLKDVSIRPRRCACCRPYRYLTV